jgi:hypothetical protein
MSIQAQAKHTVYGDAAAIKTGELHVPILVNASQRLALQCRGFAETPAN